MSDFPRVETIKIPVRAGQTTSPRQVNAVEISCISQTIGAMGEITYGRGREVTGIFSRLFVGYKLSVTDDIPFNVIQLKNTGTVDAVFEFQVCGTGAKFENSSEQGQVDVQGALQQRPPSVRKPTRRVPVGDVPVEILSEDATRAVALIDVDQTRIAFGPDETLVYNDEIQFGPQLFRDTNTSALFAVRPQGSDVIDIKVTEQCFPTSFSVAPTGGAAQQPAPVENGDMPVASNIVRGVDPAFERPLIADVYVDPDLAVSGDGLTMATAFNDYNQAAIALNGTGGTIGGKAGTIARHKLNLRSRVYPDDNPIVITTVGDGDPATITGAEILEGLTRCVAGDAVRVGADYNNIFKVNIPAPTFHANALNLHENGVFMPLVIDRLQEPEYELFMFDPNDWHSAASKTVDPANNNWINSYTDPLLTGYTQAQLEAAQVLIYGGSNRTAVWPVESADIAAGTITINQTSKGLTSNGDGVGDNGNKFALLNILPKLSDVTLPIGRWGYFEEGDGTISLYVRPRDEANIAANIEYSVRESCVNVATCNNVVVEGMRLVQASGDGRTKGIAIGTESDAGRSLDQRRRNVTVRNNIVGKCGTGITGNYGAIHFDSHDGVIVENNMVTQMPLGSGITGFRVSNMIVRRNDITFCEVTPVSFFGGGGSGGVPSSGWSENLQTIDNYFGHCCREIHGNAWFAYEQCNYVILKGNIFDDCLGYVTFQECSNIVFAFNAFEDGDRGNDTSANRSIADQQNGTPQPDASGFLEIFNNSSTPNPLTGDDGGNWQLSNQNNNQRMNVRNNVTTGMSFLADNPAIIGEFSSNVHCINSDLLTATDTLLPSFSDLYADPANGDFSYLPGTPVYQAGDDMRARIAEIATAWANAPIQNDAGNTGMPLDADIFNTDINGNPVDWTNAPKGPQVLEAM